MPIVSDDFRIDNISQGETVYQRCLIIKGWCKSAGEAGFLTVQNLDADGFQNFSQLSHPIIEGRFTFITMLTLGINQLFICRGSHYGNMAPVPSTEQLVVCINYVPLLQCPPLHLAIMIAKDSPLLIDCPPTLSGDHSSLDAVIAKFCTTAYMWQALTAEDMRMKGLGRRSFRLEEGGTDSVSQEFKNRQGQNLLHANGCTRSMAKVHLVWSDKTVAELNDPNIAQQNPHAAEKNKLFEYFLDALKQYGAPFEPSTRPIVAGLILDSHYSADKNLILGHAALGCYNPGNISLGMFGSHLTYSWPRSIEEINSCLLDTRCPGPTVGNDNGECASMWEACAIGQGAFLHEVGHAFGAPHTTGIMSRGYAQHWPRNFLAKTAYCVHRRTEGVVMIDRQTENNARWDLRDALSFRLFPHFWIPGDEYLEPDVRTEKPRATAVGQEADDGARRCIKLSCGAGIAQITFNDDGNPEPSPTVTSPAKEVIFTMKQIQSRFPRKHNRNNPLKLTMLGMNGKTGTVRDVWRLFDSMSVIAIPGSKVVLTKQSIRCPDMEVEDPDPTLVWTWATLLTKPRGRDAKASGGRMKLVKSIDVRTGMFLDGLYVDFEDGERVKCGPRLNPSGGEHLFGGHAAEVVDIIPSSSSGKGDGRVDYGNREIVKIQVARRDDVLTGLRIHLKDGTEGGRLSGFEGHVEERCVLEPPPGHRIVGFFGSNWWGCKFNAIFEFGILTAPRGVELPEVVYGMKELMNTDGGHAVS
ncbi:hypothetical protein PABG_02532 [Paracoccidioides brasiliensis Pb03]|nr:hypothetical protein PABG_02532 [Paracoccidioides brasiliensis Pb03]